MAQFVNKLRDCIRTVNLTMLLVLNLLRNANEALVKTANARIEVNVSINKETSEVILTVKDNGPKLSEEH